MRFIQWFAGYGVRVARVAAAAFICAAHERRIGLVSWMQNRNSRRLFSDLVPPLPSLMSLTQSV